MDWQNNVTVFEDTQKMCREHPVLIDAIARSTSEQQIILERDDVTAPTPRFIKSAQIILSQKRSFEAASQYWDKKVCVLNFASATNPGGGAMRGSTAQEECLCRCSTLFSNLASPAAWKHFYEPHRQAHNQLYNDDVIYTPGVVVFKADTQVPRLMPESKWQKVNVISCAAPNLRPKQPGESAAFVSDQDLYGLHVKRMRRILSVAAENGNDVVVLGAYGCGVFRNPPQVVAKAMKQVAEEFKNHFETIEFAVFCTPKNDENFRVFKNIFSVR